MNPQMHHVCEYDAAECERVRRLNAEMFALLVEIEENQMRATGADYKRRLWSLLNRIRGES